MLYSRTLLFIHPIYTSWHLLIPNFQSNPLPTPSLLATTNLFSMSVSLFLFHRLIQLCHTLFVCFYFYLFNFWLRWVFIEVHGLFIAARRLF